MGAPQPDRVSLHDLAESTANKLGGADKMEVQGEVHDVRSRVRTVIGKVKEANSSAITDLTAHVELDWNMDKRTAAIWDPASRKIVLNAKTALSHPHDLPFIVRHEAAHGGLLKITKGKTVKAEAIADAIAEMETGHSIGDDYDAEVEALKEIGKTMDGIAQKNGQKSGLEYVVQLYLNNGLEKVFKELLSVGAWKNRGADINSTLALFKKAFPKATVSYTGKDLKNNV